MDFIKLNVTSPSIEEAFGIDPARAVYLITQIKEHITGLKLILVAPSTLKGRRMGVEEYNKIIFKGLNSILPLCLTTQEALFTSYLLGAKMQDFISWERAIQLNEKRAKEYTPDPGV